MMAAVQSREDKIEYLRLLEEKERRVKHNKILTYYPETGVLARHLYKKHMAFFEAGKDFNERLFMAANRVGKTEGAGGIELTYHLTGDYPAWWNGRVFKRPVDVWVAGKTGKTTRDIIQAKLFGEKGKFGQGLIPYDKIVGRPTAKAGVADAFDTAMIKHKTGGTSNLQFKSFDQGRDAFEGTKKDIIWFDEEPPLDVYVEGLLRTVDTSGLDNDNGIVMTTFTPLEGMSETVLQFLPNGEIKEKTEGSKCVIMASWDDVPHLTKLVKEKLYSEIPAYQRDARTKGIPQLGSGAIYQVPESDIMVDPFEVPAHWPRGYAMDVGWNKTAVGWYALDRDNDILYKISEHYVGQMEPALHAVAIKARGDWICGVIDPAARGRNQKDGQKLMDIYTDLGLDLEPAFNGVESGIYDVWQRMSAGKFKVFKTCQKFFEEYRMYRRDEKGHIVKSFDHAMDETRYFIMSGIARMKVKPLPPIEEQDKYSSSGRSDSWMG